MQPLEVRLNGVGLEVWGSTPFLQKDGTFRYLVQGTQLRGPRNGATWYPPEGMVWDSIGNIAIARSASEHVRNRLLEINQFLYDLDRESFFEVEDFVILDDMPMHGDYIGCAIPTRSVDDENGKALRAVSMDGHFVWTVNDYSSQSSAVLSATNAEEAVSVLSGKRNSIKLTGQQNSGWCQLSSCFCACGSGLGKLLKQSGNDRQRVARVDSRTLMRELGWDTTLPMYVPNPRA